MKTFLFVHNPIQKMLFFPAFHISKLLEKFYTDEQLATYLVSPVGHCLVFKVQTVKYPTAFFQKLLISFVFKLLIVEAIWRLNIWHLCLKVWPWWRYCRASELSVIRTLPWQYSWGRSANFLYHDYFFLKGESSLQKRLPIFSLNIYWFLLTN